MARGKGKPTFTGGVVMQSSSVDPYNFQDCRFYPIQPEVHPASVTTIISQTEDWATKKTLQNWGKNNPGGREAAANRGTRLHRMSEIYLTKGEIVSGKSMEELQAFGRLKTKVLDRFEKLFWVEQHLTAPMRAVYDLDYGYAGSPDWAGIFREPKLGSIPMMLDLKTSKQPYCAFQPGRAAADFRERSLGFKKFSKARMQIAAYTRALNKLTNWDIQHAGIVVLLPDDVLYYPLDQSELELGWQQFEKRLALFYKKVQQGKIRVPGSYIPERYKKAVRKSGTKRTTKSVG